MDIDGKSSAVQAVCERLTPLWHLRHKIVAAAQSNSLQRTCQSIMSVPFYGGTGQLWAVASSIFFIRNFFMIFGDFPDCSFCYGDRS